MFVLAHVQLYAEASGDVATVGFARDRYDFFVAVVTAILAIVARVVLEPFAILMDFAGFLYVFFLFRGTAGAVLQGGPALWGRSRRAPHATSRPFSIA